MAAQEEYEDERETQKGSRRVSSQAGLSTYAGGQARSLPAVPAPGQPGSRFNPRVAERSRPNANVGKKSLNIARSAELIQGFPPAIADPGSDRSEKGVAGAAVDGFTGGLAAGARLHASQSGPESVRNASGQTLQDLTASAPGEDALPGTTQPFALDAIDAIQGKRVQSVVMNPEHVAALEALDAQRDEGLGHGGDGYGRR